jgi:hypothetical protein
MALTTGRARETIHGTDMARTRQSQTIVLANGNKVTITLGWTRNYATKTVTVARRDGTRESRTDRHGHTANKFRQYDFKIPPWATH